MSLKIGDSIPDFSLIYQSGNSRTKKEFEGHPLVLFFYPKDDTPGCTIEVCGFRDKYDLFKILGANVCGVSNDNEESHFVFSNKNKLQYPLLCDIDNALRKNFGVRKFIGMIDGRVTYIIDSDGIIRHIYEDFLDGSAHIKETIKVLKKFKYNTYQRFSREFSYNFYINI